MKKEFIPYEQALDLKKLGFDNKCLTSYSYDKVLQSIWNMDEQDMGGELDFDSTNQDLFDRNSKNESGYVTAPLYQQAFRWLREIYFLDSWIYNAKREGYWFTILDFGQYVKVNEYRSTYQEAELDCLKTLIDIAKTK